MAGFQDIRIGKKTVIISQCNMTTKIIRIQFWTKLWNLWQIQNCKNWSFTNSCSLEFSCNIKFLSRLKQRYWGSECWPGLLRMPQNWVQSWKCTITYWILGVGPLWMINIMKLNLSSRKFDFPISTWKIPLSLPLFKLFIVTRIYSFNIWTQILLL